MGNLKITILALIIFLGLVVLFQEFLNPGPTWIRLGMLVFLGSIFLAVFLADKLNLETQPEQTFIYFAYGSNMLAQRISERCPSAKIIGPAIAENYAISFSKPGKDGSGKATMEKAGHTRTFGVLYEIEEKERGDLDAEEGSGYESQRIWVRDTSKQRNVRALSYFARSKEGGLIPYDWYLALIVAGAKQHNLPTEYINKLLIKTNSKEDPQKDRGARQEALSILGKSGYENWPEFFSQG